MGAALLVWRGGAECGIEGDVVAAVARRASLDVAPAFAFGAGLAAPPCLFARQPVERRIQFPGRELAGGVNFLAALPPVRAPVVEDGLRSRFGLTLVGGLLGLLFLSGYRFTFFFT